MNAIQLLRQASAYRSVVYTYTRASEAHATRESELLLMGYDFVADIHHTADAIACRALLAEIDDPTPEGLGQ